MTQQPTLADQDSLVSSSEKHFQPLPGYATTPQPVNGEKPVPSRTLHIYHKGLTHAEGYILDSDNHTQLYRIEVKLCKPFSSKPQVEIFSNANKDDTSIATLHFHKFDQVTDIMIHGHAIAFRQAKFTSTTRSWPSAAAPGATFTWRCDKFWGGDFVCLDSQERLVAKLDSKHFTRTSSKEEGTVEVAWGVEGGLLDEIVVTGVGVIEARRRSRNASITAGSGVTGL
ncbi:hypothetical protein MMC21_001513 [Puttea exsequens]|nr:hypothetical protein [Puttea exsequens]